MENDIEIWKPLKEYEGLYEISNMGKIKSLIKKGNIKEQIRKTGLDVSTGYINVMLRKNNKPLTKRVHRLVAEAFVPNPDNKLVVNHIDGNKKNNKASNLEWMTYSENTLHSFKTGLQKKIFGDNNYITKIKDQDVFEIKKLISQGKTNKEIAKIYGVNPSQISRIKTGQRRKKPCNDIC
jgi:DNA-binding NarL/FixJ family response regulator